MKTYKTVFPLLAVLLAAGCGAVSSAPPAQTAATQASGHSAAGGRPAAGTSAQRAAAEAKAILARFVPPPGAVRLAKQPALPSGSPGMGLVYTTTAQAAGYWRVRGAATALLAWEKAHMPRSFAREDVIIGPPAWNTVYTLPTVPGVFIARTLNAQFYDVGGGQTVIVATAAVAWTPPRPPAELVPASAREVTITPSLAGNATPVTITSVPVVRRLAALVNRLPLSTVGPVPCPSGQGYTLTFRAAPGGPPVAVADGPGGCGVVQFSLRGKGQPALLAPDPAAYNNQIAALAGLHRKLS